MLVVVLESVYHVVRDKAVQYIERFMFLIDVCSSFGREGNDTFCECVWVGVWVGVWVCIFHDAFCHFNCMMLHKMFVDEQFCVSFKKGRILLNVRIWLICFIFPI